VSHCQPLLPVEQAWELELSLLVNSFSLGSLSVSAHHLFLQGDQMCYYFPQTVVGPPSPHMGWVSSAFHQVEVKSLWESPSETQDTEAIQEEAMLYCAITDSADLSQKAEP
jgi:hypothetical protein